MTDIPTQTISYFGGMRYSSSEVLVCFSRSDIDEEDEKNSDRDKYIRKVQDCKVFHGNKIHHMSHKNTFIGM